MLGFTEYSKLFLSLFAIVDPVGIMPLIIAFTTGYSLQKREHVGRIASVSVLAILIGALLLGESILDFFGISIYSFRAAGGIILLLMSINMLIRNQATSQLGENTEGDTSSSVAIVPLSTPLLAGPGAISTVILDAHKGSGVGHYVIMALIIFLLSLTVWVTFLAAPRISQKLGKIGSTIVTRMMGLLLASIAVEFIAGGLRGLFPALG